MNVIIESRLQGELRRSFGCAVSSAGSSSCVVLAPTTSVFVASSAARRRLSSSGILEDTIKAKISSERGVRQSRTDNERMRRQSSDGKWMFSRLARSRNDHVFPLHRKDVARS